MELFLNMDLPDDNNVWENTAKEAEKIPEIGSGFRFENVSFKYPESDVSTPFSAVFAREN